MAKKERISFEKALERLETIIEKLDDKSLTLEDYLELYEEGIMLSRQCSKKLEDAELRIDKVNDEHMSNN